MGNRFRSAASKAQVNSGPRIKSCVTDQDVATKRLSRELAPLDAATRSRRSNDRTDQLAFMTLTPASPAVHP